jgi:prepilin-type N-terminal cleavage/methylation domain-containing protein
MPIMQNRNATSGNQAALPTIVIKSRRGFSLVEALVAVTLATVILNIAVQLVHTVMRFQVSARDDEQFLQTARRASHQFRKDVQNANAWSRTVDPQGDFTELILTTATGAVIYRAMPHQLGRSVRQQDTISQLDEFVFPPGVDIAFEEQGPSSVALQISRASVNAGASNVHPTGVSTVYEAAATVGWDSRFHKSLERRGR